MENTFMKLYTKLSRLQWLLQRHHMQSHAEHGPMGDPTRGQGRVLAALRLQPEIATKDLSYLLGIRQQSLNQLLNKLEKSGYVVREPSEADRRIMLVKLTEQGKQTKQPPRMDFSDIFSCLSEEEQATLGEYLDRITAVLEEHLTGDERENIEEWIRAARSRMGNEQFERLMSAWGGRPFHNDPRFHPGRIPGEPHIHGDGFDELDADMYNGRPEDVPGAERFHPGYNGPIPNRQDPHSFGFGEPTPPPPPPSPNTPTKPDDEEE